VTKNYAHAHGVVGEAITAELMQFLMLKDTLPNIQSIINAPSTAPLPDTIANPGTGYALASMLTSYTARHIDSTTFEKTITYIIRLPIMYAAVFVASILTVLTPEQRSKVMGSSPTFAKWATENQEILF